MNSAYNAIFRAANDRLHSIDPERCRELEAKALKAAPRPPGPRPEMMRELLRDLADAPAGPALRQRVHDTLRRLYVAMERAGHDPEAFRTAANAYLDGQSDVAARWLDLDTLLRPWGVK